MVLNRASTLPINSAMPRSPFILSRRALRLLTLYLFSKHNRARIAKKVIVQSATRQTGTRHASQILPIMMAKALSIQKSRRATAISSAAPLRAETRPRVRRYQRKARSMRSPQNAALSFRQWTRTGPDGQGRCISED